ncbi:MAG TPA: 2-dehydropantoate 2-reductase [Candidatus Methanoperedens sp.]
MQNRIAIIGAGAIGSLVGGLLSGAGEDVTLIGRKAHVEAINKNDLVVEGAMGEIRVNVKAKEHLDFKPDLVFITVKTQDVEAAAYEIRPYVSGIPVITMQNGVRSDDIAAGVLGKENIVSCVVLLASTFLEPGRVTYSSRGRFVIGAPYGFNGKQLENVAAVLNKIIPTSIIKDIRCAHWTKLIVNLNNAIPAITGLSIQEVGTRQELRKLSFLLLKEGLDVTKLSDIRLCNLPGVPIGIFKKIFSIPVPIAALILGFLMKSIGAAPGSMGALPVLGSTLQSIKRGRSTEIDYLNGEIVALGKKLGKPAPYNAAVVNMVHQVEATGKFFSVDELLYGLEKK